MKTIIVSKDQKLVVIQLTNISLKELFIQNQYENEYKYDYFKLQWVTMSENRLQNATIKKLFVDFDLIFLDTPNTSHFLILKTEPEYIWSLKFILIKYDTFIVTPHVERSDLASSHAASKILSFTSDSKILLRTVCLNFTKYSTRLFTFESSAVVGLKIPNFENVDDI